MKDAPFVEPLEDFDEMAENLAIFFNVLYHTMKNFIVSDKYIFSISHNIDEIRSNILASNQYGNYELIAAIDALRSTIFEEMKRINHAIKDRLAVDLVMVDLTTLWELDLARYGNRIEALDKAGAERIKKELERFSDCYKSALKSEAEANDLDLTM